MSFENRTFTEELRCWAELKVPARIDAVQAAKILGFAEHDIPILVSAKLLIPLGTPVQNSVKRFSACEVIRLAADRDWLDKATRRMSGYWHAKRQRRNSGEKRLVK
jgi:hypothetical protein